jgi:hypothetical protein
MVNNSALLHCLTRIIFAKGDQVERILCNFLNEGWLMYYCLLVETKLNPILILHYRSHANVAMALARMGP